MIGSQVGVEGQVTVGGQVGQVGGERVGGQVIVGGHVGQVGAKAVKNNSHEVIMLITYGLSKAYYLYQV